MTGPMKDAKVTAYLDILIENVPDYKQYLYPEVMNEDRPIYSPKLHLIHKGPKIPLNSNPMILRKERLLYCVWFKKNIDIGLKNMMNPAYIFKTKNMYALALSVWDSNPFNYTSEDGYVKWDQYDTNVNESGIFKDDFKGAKDLDGKVKTLKEIYDERRLYCFDIVHLGSELKDDMGAYRWREYFQRLDHPTNRIRNWGCLLCCMSDIISYYKNDSSINPKTVNKKMNEMNEKALQTQLDEAMDKIGKMVPGSIGINVNLKQFVNDWVEYDGKSGYVRGSSSMMTGNVAVEYNLKTQYIPKDSDDIAPDDDPKSYKKIFIDLIKNRLTQYKPTIAKLVGEDGGTHFVLVVGISYKGIDDTGDAAYYIINDPGANDLNGTNFIVRYINCETRYSEHWKRKIKRLILID